MISLLCFVQPPVLRDGVSKRLVTGALFRFPVRLMEPPTRDHCDGPAEKHYPQNSPIAYSEQNNLPLRVEKASRSFFTTPLSIERIHDRAMFLDRLQTQNGEHAFHPRHAGDALAHQLVQILNAVDDHVQQVIGFPGGGVTG